jgi:hypothetical protein
VRPVVVPKPPADPAKDRPARVVDGLEDHALSLALNPRPDLIRRGQLAADASRALLVHLHERVRVCRERGGGDVVERLGVFGDGGDELERHSRC